MPGMLVRQRQRQLPLQPLPLQPLPLQPLPLQPLPPLPFLLLLPLQPLPLQQRHHSAQSPPPHPVPDRNP